MRKLKRIVMHRRATEPTRTDRGERRPEKISGFTEDRRQTAMFLETVRNDPSTISASVWKRGRVVVVSALENSELPGGGGESGPQWHVSVAVRESTNIRRPFDAEFKQALACFGMSAGDEDQHEAGNARHMWLAVDPQYRGKCECKATEIQVIEADGHHYSATFDHTSCNSCALAEDLGRACTVHLPDGTFVPDVQAVLDRGERTVDRRSA